MGPQARGTGTARPRRRGAGAEPAVVPRPQPVRVPDDGKNLNRCFPGDPDGTLADRLAYAAFTQLISGSDALIDVHAGDMVEALEPFALYDAGPAEDRARELAIAYGLGYVIRQAPGPGRAVGGSTSAAAAEAGIPAIIAEAGGCGLVERAAVEAHVRGLNGVLTALGMADPPPAPAPLRRPPTCSVSCGCAARTKAGGSPLSARAKRSPRDSCSAPSAASTAPASCRRSRLPPPASRCSSPVPQPSPPTASSSASAPADHPRPQERAAIRRS